MKKRKKNFDPLSIVGGIQTVKGLMENPNRRERRKLTSHLRTPRGDFSFEGSIRSYHTPQGDERELYTHPSWKGREGHIFWVPVRGTKNGKWNWYVIDNTYDEDGWEYPNEFLHQGGVYKAATLEKAIKDMERRFFSDGEKTVKNPKRRKCNPSSCKVKSHKHRKKNPLLQSVMMANPPKRKKADKSYHNAIILNDVLGLGVRMGEEFIDYEQDRYTSDDFGNITHIDGDKVIELPGYALRTYGLKKERKNPKSGPADEHLAYDLYITMTSDPRNSQQFDHLRKNLVNKMAAGTFDLDKATKGMMAVVDIGAARYTDEFGSHFNKNTRLLTARALAEDFKGEAELGNYDYLLHKKYQKNPPSAERELREFLIEKGDGYYNYGMASYEVKGLKYRQVFAPGYPVHPWRNLVKGKDREKKEYLIKEGDGYHHYGGGSFEVEGSKYRQVFAPGSPVHRWRSLSNPIKKNPSKKLTTAQRRKLPASAFGLPKSRRYPMEDKGHAISAKAYAKQELDKGYLSQADYNKVVRKANKILRSYGVTPEEGFASTRKKNPRSVWKRKSSTLYEQSQDPSIKIKITGKSGKWTWKVECGKRKMATGIAPTKLSAVSAAKSAFTKRKLRKEYAEGGKLLHNPTSKPPFREGEKVKVAEARAWIKSTGNKTLLKDFEKALKLQTKANRTPKFVEWRTLPIGSKNKLDSITALVEYGKTDETYYKPPKGSKKGTSDYVHEWGDGSGKSKPVPMYVSADGKLILNKLGKGQRATDWLRG